MIKLMKYEIRKIKNIILILSVAVFFTLFIAIGSFMKGGALVFMLFPLLLTFYIWGFDIYMGYNFINELTDNQGYLTYSLPMEKKDIVKSKGVVYLFSKLILSIVFCISAIFLIKINFADLLRKSDWSYLGYVINQVTLGQKVILILDLLLDYVISNIFSILLLFLVVLFIKDRKNNKQYLQDKKIGIMWFFSFMVIKTLASIAISKVSSLVSFRYNLVKLNTKGFSGDLIELLGVSQKSLEPGGLIPLNINIGYYLIILLMIILIYKGVIYLLEEKIELS